MKQFSKSIMLGVLAALALGASLTAVKAFAGPEMPATEACCKTGECDKKEAKPDDTKAAPVDKKDAAPVVKPAG